ncbi:MULTISPECIES: muconolactone Delta-isomerase [unclassified Arthrobacter]|uniref:muconolactone Delta-isomerase n=1 Tax=unclassified Arthrobacter TaxID=235627 RepID=UPI00288334CD|nr:MULTISPECIES: muconolactone Delta-isomerase [unclassified Arthrobacter]
MLYLVRMDVSIPPQIPAAEVAAAKTNEKERSQELQRDGRWLHLWRVVGQYANYSIFDVDSHDQLHDLLQTLPLYPYMTIDVIPLAQHPSAITTLEQS